MYTSDELQSLMADVTKEFTAHLAKAEDSFKLAKAEDGSDKKDKPAEEAKPEDKKAESDKPAEKAPEGDKKEGESAPPFAAKEGEKEAEGEKPAAEAAPAQAAPAEGEAHGYDEEDLAHMHSMYSSMSPAELRAHHDAVRKCMDGQGLAKCEDSMAKSEKDLVVEVAPSEEVILLKSELESAKAESEASRKNLEAVESFLKKFVEKTAPAGKAITSLDIIAKTESVKEEKVLSKSEIDAKLLAKAKDQSLSKSDREAINSYYFSKNVESVRHLL